ncbi:MAG: large conductance mechanosensitive channel protein MscL [Gluconacetobacter diazotrophicus]|nr:large conductance mechanosensitive channel protein MscL [Gluconacetobacter diazotrophicus]
MKSPVIRKPGWIDDFRAFILRGNVVDLAVGIIIGAAFTGIVQSLVKDIFTPIIGLVVGGIDFSNIFVTLNGQHYATLAEAQKAGAPTLNVGVFLNALIQFLIIAFVVFWVVRLLNKMYRPKPAEAAAPPPPTETELLLTQIRDILARRDGGAGIIPPSLEV